eukprot:CAMPEP_0183473916 /NCGR_PEP_ID=MMETSP0370-20130417/162193_1 /TAXON_ID=268820 /ORGANISM="Peridinium aciculiferum, Strain PAER-2" /LENGTH=66 /DNA_ID=CAMNT_0025666625 /DNA_START=95 /DNA_END=296 /DNA_ORIENTATION=+
MVQEHLPTTARRMVLHLWDVAKIVGILSSTHLRKAVSNASQQQEPSAYTNLHQATGIVQSRMPAAL